MGLFDIFYEFHREYALAPAVKDGEIGDINFLGVFIPEKVDARRRGLECWSGRTVAHFDLDQSLPSPNHEDLFEYIDLLYSVSTSSEKFTMVEVGAGYGRWILNAFNALNRRIKPGVIDYQFYGFEADLTRLNHCRMLAQSAGIKNIVLYPEAVVSKSDQEKSKFASFSFHKADPARFGGAVIDESRDSISGRGVEGDTSWRVVADVNTCRLSDRLSDVGLIDFVDFDIQNAEISVIPSEIEFLTTRARVVHVGTHSPLADEVVKKSFTEHGWIPRWELPWRSTYSWEKGVVTFTDGVFSYANPKFSKL